MCLRLCTNCSGYEEIKHFFRWNNNGLDWSLSSDTSCQFKENKSQSNQKLAWTRRIREYMWKNCKWIRENSLYINKAKTQSSDVFLKFEKCSLKQEDIFKSVHQNDDIFKFVNQKEDVIKLRSYLNSLFKGGHICDWHQLISTTRR